MAESKLNPTQRIPYLCTTGMPSPPTPGRPWLAVMDIQVRAEEENLGGTHGEAFRACVERS
jgi:hypothetical protein